MTGKIMEKDSTMKIDGGYASQEEQPSGSSSNCSSPRSCANSASTSLDAELSKVSLSGMSINSQLEALANTNLLTVRIKLIDHLENESNEMQSIVSKIEAACHQHKGTFVNAANIEPFEYLPDNERLNILEEHKDVYIFENGNSEFANFNSSGDKEANSNYDRVLQVQFKRFNTLKSVCNVVQNVLRNKEQVIEKWSISVNDHALAQPGNLYIKGVPKNMLMDQIIPIFSKFGPVSSLKIICDSVTGESLGYGFISYPLGSQASKCINELNGKMLGASTLFINFHIERKERERIYRDNIKENSDDEKFKGVFVGNLPLFNSENEILTPGDVIKLFKEGLASSVPDLGIESAYFPRKNRRDGSQSEIETEEEENLKAEGLAKEESGAAENPKPCCSQQDDNPFKNYGFIKFVNHAQALRAIEVFNDYEWLGNKLVVNKAVQNKAQTCHHKKPLAPAGYGNRSDNQYFVPPSPYGFYGGIGNMFFPYMNSRGSLLPSSSGEPDHSDSEVNHPMNRPLSAGSYPHSFNTFEQMQKPQQGPPMGPFDPSASNSSMFPMNAYGLMTQNSPFALPLPTRDQQESNLYVKHIPLSWKDEDLYEFYHTFGEIISAKIITVGGGRRDSDNQSPTTSGGDSDDPKSLGTSRGYGFVCFKNPLDASRAILATDDYPLSDTHTLHVSFAQKRSKHSQGGIDNASHLQRTTSENHPPHLKPGSRRASFNDHSRGHFNVKFLNAMRQQGAPNGGNMPSNFMPGGHAWPGMPMVPPSVPHTISSVPFVPSTGNPSMMMMGPYMMSNRGSMSDDTNDEASS